MRFRLHITLSVVLCALAGAVPTQAQLLWRNANLDFGEVAPTGAAGSVSINALTGAVTATNGTILVAPSRGSVTLIGRENTSIVMTVTAGALVCDPAYLGACAGTPTMSLTHSFPGQTPANCPLGNFCILTVYIGGTFGYSGLEEGRWTTTITVTANNQ